MFKIVMVKNVCKRVSGPIDLKSKPTGKKQAKGREPGRREENVLQKFEHFFHTAQQLKQQHAITFGKLNQERPFERH